MMSAGVWLFKAKDLVTSVWMITAGVWLFKDKDCVDVSTMVDVKSGKMG